MSLSYSVYRFFNFRDEIVKSILFSRKCRSYRLLWCVSYEINVHKSKFYVEILHKLNLWDEIPLSRTPNYLFLLLRPYESNIGDKFGATVVYSTTKERTNWIVTTFNGTSSRIKMILLVTLCVCVCVLISKALLLCGEEHLICIACVSVPVALHAKRCVLAVESVYFTEQAIKRLFMFIR